MPYFDLYRKQVVKQADLVLAMALRPDAFTLEQWAMISAARWASTVSSAACTGMPLSIAEATAGTTI